MSIQETPDSGKVFTDTVFERDNAHIASEWQRITQVYPAGVNQPLLPDTFSREQFGQGNHYECFMLSALATLVRFPDVIRSCFVSKKVRKDGRYTFQFFRGEEWVKVEIDDRIAMEEGEVLYVRSPTEHWWPLLLEKAYAKFYASYDHLEGCTLQETFHDLTGNPVLNIPMDAKLAKAAGADVTEGFYWLDLAQRIQSGQFAAAVLTKDIELETMGLQREQQYGVLEVFSLTGTSSINDIVIHLHNPFEDEEYLYKGPLNSKDTTWDAKQRAKHDVDDERSIFLPLNTFLKIMNSVQLCYMTPVETDATYFHDEWKGESAGGNPTSVAWRKNPLYYVRNTGSTASEVVVVIKQEDQRRFTSPDEMTKYLQCGMVLINYAYAHPIPTFWVTGNNHKPIHKSLFLNSREVANTMTIPPNSLCYLVPSCMHKGAEGQFNIALYRMKGVDYSDLTIKKLAIPGMNWANPASKNVELRQKEKDRVDFYVDEETDIHILMHQTKPYVSKSGGDAMTEDYMGMYLYDDTDRKIGGVHAATNFREISIIHHVPRSGRYAISITCPRAKSEVPAYVTMVGSHGSNVRVVDPPEDATMFDDEDIIDEGEEADLVANPIDYTPVVFDVARHNEQADSDAPYEDKRFYMDNRGATSEPWVHIGDLYPEGKTKPLLPEQLGCDQFEQGDHYDCSTLTGFAAMVERHPDVIRNCFISKKPRKDGRYTFQFHRYGQWIKIEIDDRIPMVKGDTVFCRSPTRHWWPLLLEKAYAKFYTLYQNLEDISQGEVFHDFTGRPVIFIPMEADKAKAVDYDITSVQFWRNMNRELDQTAVAALALGEQAEQYGLHHEGSYAVLGFVEARNSVDMSPADVLVKMYNPYEDSPYTGPMHKDDPNWTSEMRTICNPAQRNIFYVPADVFLDVFANVQQAYVKGPLDPCWNFNSEWGDTTNGGNASLVTWRENPLYVARNTSDTPVQIIGMIRQPDQRHLLHRQTNHEVNYIQCALVVAESVSAERIPTYLVTGNNHRRLRSGLYLQNREVTDIITIPADSLCYVVPTGMQRDKGKFIFSYWFLRKGDDKKLDVRRFNTDVARQLPAIAHVDLINKGHARVDILVDVPTDLHILLKQEKPFRHPSGGDAIAQDFLSMYLYDDKDRRISPSTQATNNREIGLVQHVDKPGRYAIGVNCTAGTGDVPCKVEVVAQERAHVRTTEPPENARELGEIDLSFLEPEPEGVPLADLPLDEDAKFQELLEALKKLHNKPNKSEEELRALERKMNDRAHELARAVLAKDRPKYLAGQDLERVAPMLEEDPDYVAAERERHMLKKDPRNAARVREIEEELRERAVALSDTLAGIDLGFMDPEYEGIPRDDIELLNDPAFEEMAQTRTGLLRDPAANARKINDLEDKMHDRATELAKDMHEKERTYLDSEPEGVPLDLLPLNEDDPFSRMEDELRALYRKPKRDARAIKDVQGKLNDRAHELAGKLKNDERELFLDPAPLGIPVADLPLDSDPEFHAKEMERLQLRKEDPLGNRDDIKALEDEMNERARELAKDQQANQRAFLDQDPYGIPLEKLGLDYNDEFLRKEEELRALQKDPRRNAKAIGDLKGEMRALVDAIAAAEAARDRAFLDPEIEGRLVQTLPLVENPEFKDLDTKRRRALNRGGDTSKVPDMEDRMNDIAHDIAHDMNVAERPEFMDSAYKGVPIEDLPLDDDQPFRALEVKRQQQKQDPRRNARAIADTEQDLNDRAMELATEKLKGDRNYLDPEPEGVPLRLVPLDSDPTFTEMEAQRAKLKKDPRRNAKPIVDIEDQLNDRAHELAKALKEKERPKFLDAKFCGIPYTELPLDQDQPFRDMEAQRLLLKEQPQKNATAIQDLEEALNDRAGELAKEKLARERAFLDPAPLGIALEELPLDQTPAFLAKEERLRALNKDPRKNAAPIKALQEEMSDMVKALAAEELGKMRGFLDPEPEGRLVESLPLNDDPKFHQLEARYRDLKKSPKASPQDVADLEELMNDRAHELAKDMNRKERPQYLQPAPKGVPVEELPLDTDEEFSNLEAQRARLMRQPAKNKKAIADIEDALNLRAEELAQEKIQADRAFLDEAPQGIPLKYIPLDNDKEFAKIEAQRMALRAQSQNARSPAPKVRELEAAMNEHANALAKAVKQQVRSNVLPARVGGIAREALQLDDDVPFTDLEVAHIAANGDGDNDKGRDLGDAMHKRAVDVAAKLRGEERENLGHPLGFDAEDLPLDSDPEYLQKEAAVVELRVDPKKNAQAIKAGEAELRAIAMEMAKAKAAEERKDYIDAEPEGRRLDNLGLDDDPTFVGIEEQYRKSKRDPYADQDRLHDLEQMMNDRAHDLAKMKNAQEREKYLDSAPRNVPLAELPLDTDEEFGQLEAQRAKLCQDPRRNANAIRDVEDKLNDRADVLAAEALKNDRIFLDDKPEGVAQRQLPIDEDQTFRTLEMQRAALKSAPAKDERAIRAVEEQMQDHLRSLAKEVKLDARRDMEPNPLGIPLEDLDAHLDADPRFHELEEMYRDAKKNPTKAKMASQLLDQMNERAKEVAQAVHDEERQPLQQEPNGVPLSTLPLNEDPEFNALENEARALRNAPGSGRKNANKLAGIEDRLNARAEELANEARKQYVDAAPEGVPMELLDLGSDPAFVSGEEELRRLEKNPVANRQGIKDLKGELNAMAHDKARKMLEGDRGYLDQNPEGVMLRHIPLDADATFHDLETRRAKLKAEDPRANQKAITALESQLNDRAHELAKEVKDSEVRSLDQDPHGVPYSVIVPHNDDEFKELAAQLRELKADPKRNAAAIKTTKDRMNDRGIELADAMLKHDREYLEPEPEGVPLKHLPLDSDPQFSRMEVERAKLKAKDPIKNAKKVKELEEQLNARAEQLAEAQKQEDLRGLSPKPEGIALAVIDPHSDEKFASYLPRLRELKADPKAKPEQLQQVVDAMNARAHELAADKLRGDRPAYVEEQPNGVPRDLLPLDTDPQFHDMEVQRVALKAQDPRRNAAKINDLEDRLRERANELADQQRAKDLENIDQAPEGLPVALVNPHEDPAFAKLVDQHRQLAKDPKVNAEPLAKVEAQMNERAHELAKAMLGRDNAFLDPTPQGVPLAELPLDTDPEFHRLEVERAKLKAQDPRRNAAKIKDLEGQMNNRAHELARAQLAEDLRGVDPAPRGLPVELLNPHADADFASPVKRMRELKKSPIVDPKTQQAVLDEMNKHVRAMADEAMDRGYLDPNPEGVPLADLPLDSDPEFHDMEVERAKLKLKDPRRNARAIKDLEQQLNDRAHELAKKQLEDDLSGCDPVPEGIPLALLKPTEDPKIAAMIPQLRALKKDPKKNAEAIQNLENQMNNRAYELADQLLEGDRGYLDPKPDGVALAYLPLDKDPAFAEMEVERAKLKMQDPRRNQRRIADLEEQLNDRAEELAAAKKAAELAHFPPQYNGIDTAAMKPHDDPGFAALVEQLRALEKAGKATSPEAEKVLKAMDERLEELAKEKVEGDLWFLDKEPEGIPLEEVPVEDDPAFQQLRQERANLKAKDPRANAGKIKGLEDEMNERAHALAKDMKENDFDGVDPDPLGIPLELLHPRDDPQVAKLLPELRRAKKSPRDAQKAKDLLNKLNDRVQELAQDALSGERPAYLDPKPEGVALADLPLDADGIYAGLELERAKLVLQDPAKNAKQIEDLEDRLNERTHELAQQVLKDDLKNIDSKPEGIPVEAVKPHDNPDFHELATRARELRKDPRRNAEKLAAVEDQMNNLAHRMAAEMLGGDRGYLDPEPEGVPVDVLPLNTDPQFHEMEVQRAVLAAQDPVRNKQAIADLEDRLNGRAHELAEEQRKEDLHGLNHAPLGVPVALLNPHEDPHFAALLPELRSLKSTGSPRSNARLNDTQAKLDDILDALADEYLENDRAQYLDPTPEGVPLAALPLNTDPEFRQLEAERLDLISKNSKANKDAIKDLEAALNERAHELAKEQRKNDRAYLEPEPQGVPLDVLPLDTDRQFGDLEAKRAALKAKDPVKNAAAIHDLEDQLNDRANQLAEDQIAEDLRAVDPLPEDVPVRLLKPHDDPEFARMVNALRSLRADPRADPKKIADLEQDTNDRVHELANDALTGDRGRYLDPKPEGIPVEALPLDSDPLYHQMEVERAKLALQDPKKNQAKIADLEDRLNDRAHELAKEQRARDLQDLNEAPRGIPVELLQPHDDETFASLAAQRRDPTSSPNKSRDISAVGADPTRELLNGRLEEMARQMLEGDRGYLDPSPEGVPLRVLPLDEDPEFHDMEVRRAVLKAKDPKKNAAAIKDLEDQLNDRAHDLAKAALSGDRGYLAPEPQGVPLAHLPLDNDAKFHQMEVERAKLKAQDPKRNADKIRALEDQLNDRADELAEAQKKEDLRNLDERPRGVPLEGLNPHDDAEFASHLPELRRLKKEQPNHPKVRELQAKLDNRADELAKAQIDRDRGFLDKEPEGIPLAQVPLDNDKPFTDLEKQLRQAKQDPKRNEDKIADLQEQMNDRAHELARDLLKGDRGYLDPEPESVPISDVPIDADPKFRELEAQRAKLKEDPKKNEAKINALEEQLNDRAHELAKAQKEAARGFLNPTSSRVPKALLPLDDDAPFAKMEQQLRRLSKDPKRNAGAIENLKGMMQDRADELGENMVKGDRDKYLEATPEGVPVEHLPLDSDAQYSDAELKRAVLKAQDPVKNKQAITELEKALNDRAHELAKEQRQKDRAFLDPEPEGIPIADVPLDNDSNFLRLEDYLRKLKKDLKRNADAIAGTQECMNDRAHELAKGVVAEDLACLPRAAYRGIPKEDLNLHSYPKFRDAANRRRVAKRRNAPDVKMIEEEMDKIASEIADDVVDNERAFLDAEPEGMLLADVPLDDDKEFAALEAERRRRAKDPRSAKRNKDVIRDLEDKMNDRAHQLAKDAFAKQRGFMDKEPEGVPLERLPLDTDPEVKDAEIARYKAKKDPKADPKKIAALEKRMNDRAHELAKKETAKDRAFLDPEPEGVPLAELPLNEDAEFNELAKQRQALKNAGKGRDPKVKELEEKMNDRAHDIAKDFLNKNRVYLNQEPQNVPLADVPLNRDPIFREMEADLMKAKKDPRNNADKVAGLQEDLNNRVDELAKDMLRKERAHQESEPLGVPLEELPLNYDPILNPLERKRRDLKKDPKRNADALRNLEPEIAARVEDIARDFLAKERAFLDQEPEGMALERLPLSEDKEFHEMEKDLRALRKQPAKNKDAIEDLEERMNDRVHELAKEYLAKDRDYLDKEPLGVPVQELPLNDDAAFRDMEEKRRALKKKDPRGNAKAIKDLEDQLNDRALQLAQEKLGKERAFLDNKPEGILIKDLPLDKDKPFKDMEKQLRQLRKDPRKNANAIRDLEDDLNNRVHTLAKRQLADDRNFLNPEPRGVPLADLALDEDPEFRKAELARREAKKDPKQANTVRELENMLNDHVERIVGEYLKKDRAYLDPEPEGVPLEELPLDTDQDFHGMEVDRRKLNKDPAKNARTIKDLEGYLNNRAHELAKEKKGYQDPEFHEANEDIAEQWPRIRELYPEGIYDPVTPDTTLPSDITSAPQDMGFLAPFIAALARHTVLISRLFQDKAHPQNQPYRVTLFNPDSSPVTVEVDDRVPCDDKREPKFTQVPSRMWYPLLLEKAYAKFVGGYENFNNCNAHDTLRDLTGRPVLHISLEDPKHAAATNMGDYTTPAFWRRVMEDLDRGDIFVCVANGSVPNGLHPQCSYALMDVVEVKPGTSDPAEIVVKVHNCYTDASYYNGPLRKGDSNWTADVKRACNYSADENDMIYMPLPAFLDNFSCMQRCHINCGDRLSSPGEWNDFTAGGTSKYTTFRSNPIYLVENKTSRPATILAEVRHTNPLYVDETNCKQYPYTGLTLMQPSNAKLPPTPFITNGTHKFLQKGMMLDSREVCAEMELPPSSTCYLIPYTKDRGTMGEFFVSIYPDMAKVTLTPLRHASLTLKPLRTSLTLQPGDEQGERLDFMVNDASDVHILLHQTKVTDANSIRKGDAVAEDEVTMTVFNEYGIKIATTGEPSNAREHALIFKAPQGGRYSLLLSCAATSTKGPCTANLEIFTPSTVSADFVPVAPDAKPLNPQAQSRFPTLSRTATAPGASRGASRGGSNVRRTDSLPPINQRSVSSRRGSREEPPRRQSRGRR